MGNRVSAEQVTASHDWYEFRVGVTTGAAGDQGEVILSTVTSGGSPTLRSRHKGTNLDAIFHQRTPNGVSICAWLEQFSTNSAGAVSGMPFRFRVDAFRGPNGDLDRVMYISAVTGTYKLSARPGNSHANPPKARTAITSATGNTGAARFADTMTEVTAYNNGVTLRDAAGNNGKATASFDLIGAAQLAVNVVSTLNGGVKAGFAITGW